jgi:hypothetical protein
MLDASLKVGGQQSGHAVTFEVESVSAPASPTPARSCQTAADGLKIGIDSERPTWVITHRPVGERSADTADRCRHRADRRLSAGGSRRP